MVVLTFLGLPIGGNESIRSHHMKIYKDHQSWKEIIGWEVRAKYPKTLYQRAKVHFVISVGDRRRHDPDNLLWSVCKVTLDALKGYTILDDSIDNVELSFAFNRDKPRGFCVEVEPL